MARAWSQCKEFRNQKRFNLVKRYKTTHRGKQSDLLNFAVAYIKPNRIRYLHRFFGQYYCVLSVIHYFEGRMTQVYPFR